MWLRFNDKTVQRVRRFQTNIGLRRITATRLSSKPSQQSEVRDGEPLSSVQPSPRRFIQAAGDGARSSASTMSQATKRKHVVNEVLGDFVTPTENQQIVKVTGSRGNNLHEAVTALGEVFLVSMPTKFRKNLWIKRGDYVIVDPIEEGEKVKAEISFILYKDHIQNLQKQQLWPEGFMVESPAPDQTSGPQKTEEKDEDEEASSSEDDESDLFVNTNRCNYQYSESEEEEDDDDDKSEEEDKDK